MILLFLLYGCAPTAIGFSEIDSSCDLCIVEGELNGKRTHFLIDTGSGITTLDDNQRKTYSFFVKENTVMQVGGFANTHGDVNEASGVASIRINGVELVEPAIYATDLHKLVLFIENCTSKTISGIIGVPVLKRHRLIIDLSCNKLYESSAR